MLEIDGADCGYKVEDARLLWAIQRLPSESFSAADARKLFSGGPLDDTEVSELWQFMVEAGIVTSAAKRPGIAGAIAPSAAGGYHAYTRDYPFMQMKRSDSLWADNGMMIDYTREEFQPSIFQEFDCLKRVPLPRVEEYLISRERNKPYSLLEKLFFSLNYCGGARDIVHDGFNKEYHFLQLPTVRKAVPSGGGRHPTEVFVVVRCLPGLLAGIYHYNVLRNSLDLLNEDPEQIRTLLPDSSSAPASILMTSKLERAMWRYREARSWRAVLVDAGHMVHAFRFLLSTMGVETFRDNRISLRGIGAALGVSCDEQPCLAVVSIKEEE